MYNKGYKCRSLYKYKVFFARFWIFITRGSQRGRAAPAIAAGSTATLSSCGYGPQRTLAAPSAVAPRDAVARRRTVGFRSPPPAILCGPCTSRRMRGPSIQDLQILWLTEQTFCWHGGLVASTSKVCGQSHQRPANPSQQFSD
jgi:hypothetical protein